MYLNGSWGGKGEGGREKKWGRGIMLLVYFELILTGKCFFWIEVLLLVFEEFLVSFDGK